MSVLARYNPFTDKIKKVDKGTNFGIQPRNAGAEFRFRGVERSEYQVGGVDRKGRYRKDALLALAPALKTSRHV